MNCLKYLDKKDVMILPDEISKVNAIKYIVENSFTLNFWGLDRREEIIDQLLGREFLASTGMGKGIAVPHIMIYRPSFPEFPDAIALFGYSRAGIEWDALDGKLVHYIAMSMAEQRTELRLDLLFGFPNIFYRIIEFLPEMEYVTSNEELYNLIIELNEELRAGS